MGIVIYLPSCEQCCGRLLYLFRLKYSVDLLNVLIKPGQQAHRFNMRCPLCMIIFSQVVGGVVNCFSVVLVVLYIVSVDTWNNG